PGKEVVNRRQLRKSLRTNFNPGPRDYLNRAKLRTRQALNLPAWWLGGRLDRPIFIIGAPRSGTSLLYAILRTHPQLAHWPGEAHEVWEAEHHPALNGWDSNALDASDLTEPNAAYIRRQFFLVTGRGHRLSDKTPRNALRIPFINALFPDARFIYLKREGRDNVNSLINAWRTGRYRTYRLDHEIPGVDQKWWKFVLYPGWEADRRGPLEIVCAHQWTACNSAALQAEVPSERWLEIRYEDLIADPVGRTEELMRGLGLPADAGVRAAAARLGANPINVVTPPERGKWKKENPKEIESIAGIVGPLMKEMGYDDAD
ncbi:MAG: sulfotransferase, partial [Actinomycetota bacterium]